MVFFSGERQLVYQVYHDTSGIINENRIILAEHSFLASTLLEFFKMCSVPEE